ncbi:MAG: hypothetical protein L0216_05305 [Planctomycetales bacterium]|nr:hypothetical protein [Planctomycetales bacterium]
MRRILVASSVAGLALALAGLVRAGEALVWETSTAEDFRKGELEGCVVADPGRLLPGRATSLVDVGGASVFAIAADPKGGLLVATGRPAALVAVRGAGPAKLLEGAPGEEEKEKDKDKDKEKEKKGEKRDEKAGGKDEEKAGGKDEDKAGGKDEKPEKPAAKPKDPPKDPKEEKAEKEKAEREKMLKAGDIAFTSLAADAAGNVFVGTFPGGRVYKVVPGGAAGAKTTIQLPDPYVWALTTDAAGNVYAGTGPEGKVYKIGPGGDVSLVHDTEEKNIVSLCLDEDGSLLFGSAEKGLLFRRDPSGKVAVVFDFPDREVRSIVRNGGSLWIGANSPQKEFDQKEFAETLATALAKEGADGSTTTGTRDAALKKLLKGAVYRLDPWKAGASGTARIEQVFDLKENYILGLVPDEESGVYVAGGREGRVFRIVPGPEAQAHVVFDLKEGQVLALGAGKDGLRAIGCGGPGKLHLVGSGLGGTFLSEVHDAKVRARFGRVSWNGAGSAKLQTRSGATAKPDATWSEWASPAGDRSGGAVGCPPNRYIQYRVQFGPEASSWVDRVTITLLPENQRPTISEVQVGKKKREATFRLSDVEREPVKKIQFKAQDPDGDALEVRVFYRMEGDAGWIEASEKPVDKPPFDWDTGRLPEGIYRLKIVARDAPGNTPERALVAEWESRPIVVDNNHPAVLDLRSESPGGPGRWVLRGRASDSASPIVKVEFSVGGVGGPFSLAAAEDDLYDSKEEPFRCALGALAPGDHAVFVRAMDAAGNERTERAMVRVK